MKHSQQVAIIGTGFLGKALANRFTCLGTPVMHTFNLHQTLSDSIQFNLLSQNIDAVLPLAEVDVVIFASKFEDGIDTQQIFQSMCRIAGQLVDKRVIYISSDAVFDGFKGEYSEDDPPAPRTKYGINKRLCEDVVRQTISNYCIIRTSYIYGYSLGILDPRLAQAQQQLRARQVFERFVDMYKSPTEVNQLSDAIIMLRQSDFCGTIHVAGARMSVYDFYLRALGSMGEEVSYIRPLRMPSSVASDWLPDTSLDISLFKSMTGFLPTTIESSLQQPLSAGLQRSIEPTLMAQK